MLVYRCFINRVVYSVYVIEEFFWNGNLVRFRRYGCGFGLGDICEGYRGSVEVEGGV